MFLSYHSGRKMPPQGRYSLVIFLSLFQIPIAQILTWIGLIVNQHPRCVAYGVLPEEEAAKVYKKIIKRKGIKKAASGSSSSTSKSSSSAKKKKIKKVLNDVEYDAGMDAGGDEGIGVAVM
jgi:hypothetical protein